MDSTELDDRSDRNPNEPPSHRECWGNAARILRNAEMVTDRGLMDQYDKIACSWMALGSLLAEDAENQYA